MKKIPVKFPFFRLLSLVLVMFLLISCASTQKGESGTVLPDPDSAPKAASCSDYTPFRYFYARQMKEGLSGWEIAYLLSLGYTSDQLAAMDFDQKRLLLLPGVTGLPEGSEHYNKLYPDDQKKLAEFGMTPGDYEGLTALGFQNIQWLSQEKIEFLLPLDGLREKLMSESDILFNGYPQLFEDKFNAEEMDAFYFEAEERGLSRDEIQFLRNGSIPYEMMLTLSEPELNNLFWDLPMEAGRNEELSRLGYTAEEFDRLSADEEAYIFPFENLLSKLEEDGFSWTTIRSVERDSNGAVTCKMLIRFILESKQAA